MRGFVGLIVWIGVLRYCSFWLKYIKKKKKLLAIGPAPKKFTKKIISWSLPIKLSRSVLAYWYKFF
jgi:hypothetical protein